MKFMILLCLLAGFGAGFFVALILNNEILSKLI
jgi:hypothetical protein